MVKKINLGSGEHKKSGYINVDWNPLVEPDILFDLNNLPYPFEDNSIDLVEAFHTLEHLRDPFMILKEIHRILKPGGILHLKVPHFSRGFTQPEHKAGFDVTFPNYFRKSFVKSGFFGVEYDLEKMEMRWMAFPYLLRNLGYGRITVLCLQGLSKVISFFANLNPNFCSRVWCFWVGGFEEIEFKFKCRK